MIRYPVRDASSATPCLDWMFLQDHVKSCTGIDDDFEPPQEDLDILCSSQVSGIANFGFAYPLPS